MGLTNHPQMVVVYGIFCASHIIHQYIICIYISIISSLFIINPWYNHIMIIYNRYIPTYDIPRYIQSITRFGWWKTHLCDTQVVAADNFAESLWASGTLHLHRRNYVATKQWNKCDLMDIECFSFGFLWIEEWSTLLLNGAGTNNNHWLLDDLWIYIFFIING